MLVLFAAGPERSMADTAWQAAACARALVAWDYTELLDMAEPIALHVGLATSEDLWSVHVGGVHNRWEFLLTGGALTTELSAALEHAGRGQVACSKATARLLGSNAQLDASDRGACHVLHAVAWPAAAAGAARQPCSGSAVVRQYCQRYIPAYALPFLEAGVALGELRRCTVAFINLLTPDVSTDSGLAAFQRTVAALQEETFKALGEVRQIITDDKGTVAIVVFGLQATAKAAYLGLRALDRISQRLAAVGSGLPPATGVTTSDCVFFGAIGSHERCEAAVVGQAVNMAARICGKCGPGLHCDEATRQAAAALALERRDLTFEPLPPITVKGRDEPMPISRVSAPAGS